MGIGHFRRLDNLSLGGILLGVPDVVVNGSGEQKRLLQNHTDLPVQTFPGYIPQIHPVRQYLSVVHIVQPHQQINQRGLSGTGGTN